MKTAIETMFQSAFDNGFRKPKLRARGFLFYRAPDTGVNKGAIYVKDDRFGIYLGKILEGKLNFYGMPAAEVKAIEGIANDPQAAAVKYGRETGTCSICSRHLDNAVSVAMGIGPICAGKLGIPLITPPDAGDIAMELL